MVKGLHFSCINRHTIKDQASEEHHQADLASCALDLTLFVG